MDQCSESAPSEWVRRWAHLVPARACLLDMACGRGRHTRFFSGRGVEVCAVDRDAEALGALAGLPGVQVRQMNLEGTEWPLAGQRFDAIVVTNYLFRPRLPDLLGLLDAAGVLIYETFLLGNETLGRPSNPDYLLREDELFEWVAGHLRVVAFEQGRVERPQPAMVQRLCAVGRARAEPPQLNFALERT